MISLKALDNSDWRKVLLMAFSVALVCGLVVSTTHTLLQPRQQENIARFQQAKLASMLERVPGLQSSLLNASVDSLSQQVIDLTSGWYTEEHAAADVDMVKFAQDPLLSTELSAETDLARLKRRSNYAPVYVLSNQGALEYLILPVFGNGYQSLIKAWLILGSDLNTIHALSVIDQDETPGLGARITDESWQSQFNQKVLRDAQGAWVLAVVKPGNSSEYEVDGITGATRTGNGINNMIAFWFGPSGYGPFLERLAAGEKG